MYLIRALCHRTDISMGAHGFSIDLSPAWRDAVAKSAITQENVNSAIERLGREWLDCTGHKAMYDPDNCGQGRGKNAPPGPNARPLYSPREIRVSWGEWGIEHLSIPGNACGLDICRGAFGTPFHDGASLHPHNVDSLHQKYLLLIVFTTFAEHIVYAGTAK